jgi:hypothetical protein
MEKLKSQAIKYDVSYHVTWTLLILNMGSHGYCGFASCCCGLFAGSHPSMTYFSYSEKAEAGGKIPGSHKMA